LEADSFIQFEGCYLERSASGQLDRSANGQLDRSANGQLYPL
jgi:hypothetical protein